MSDGITANQLQSGVVTVLSQTIELTDAQIKALPTTPIVIVPATEVINYSGLPTKLQIPLFAMWISKTITDAYTNINAACGTLINLGSDNSFIFAGPFTGGAAFEQDGFTIFFPVPSKTGTESGAPVLPSSNNLKDSLLDNAIVIAVNNQGDGNFTEGNPGNSVMVTVLYTIIDL